jgi:hypothetical protein
MKPQGLSTIKLYIASRMTTVKVFGSGFLFQMGLHMLPPCRGMEKLLHLSNRAKGAITHAERAEGGLHWRVVEHNEVAS